MLPPAVALYRTAWIPHRSTSFLSVVFARCECVDAGAGAARTSARMCEYPSPDGQPNDYMMQPCRYTNTSTSGCSCSCSWLGFCCSSEQQCSGSMQHSTSCATNKLCFLMQKPCLALLLASYPCCLPRCCRSFGSRLMQVVRHMPLGVATA